MAGRSVVKVVQPAVAALAGFYLSTLLCLALWALAPLLLGWQPTVVMSGSMEPTIVAGDILVAATVGPEDVKSIKPGMVLLAVNPLAKETLYTHRVINILPDGRIITKGDNNGSLDPEPLPTANIRGIEKLRVPGIGMPIEAFHTGNLLPLALFVIVTTAAVVIVVDDEKRTAAAKAAEDATENDETDPAADEAADPPAAPAPVHATVSTWGRSRRLVWPVGRRKQVQAVPVYSTRREARVARQRELGALAKVIARATTVMALGAALVIGGSAAAFTATTKPPTSNLAAAASFVATGVASCNGATYTANANVTVACEIGAKTGTSQNYTLTVTGTGALTAWTLAADWTSYTNFVKANFTGNKVVNGSPTAKTGYSISGPVGTGGCSTQTVACNYQYVSSAKAPIVFTFQIITTI